MISFIVVGRCNTVFLKTRSLSDMVKCLTQYIQYHNTWKGGFEMGFRYDNLLQTSEKNNNDRNTQDSYIG